jgi:hypothetical protein
MKNLFALALLFILALENIPAQDKALDKLDFIGISLSKFGEKPSDADNSRKLNIAYSPVLPAGAVYNLTDRLTGKQAMIEIGLLTVNQSPYNIYLNDYLYNYFAEGMNPKPEKFDLKLKFIGWNKEGEEAQSLDIQSLMVEPENSLSEISANGKDKYYIQLGSYSYHQNAYPAITELLPYLEVKPHFYMIKKESEKTKPLFRILAGPYSVEDARRIVNILNRKKSTNYYLQSSDSVIEKAKSGP